MLDHREIAPVDCDLHVTLPGTSVLVPFLEDYWREQVLTRGIDKLELTGDPLTMPASKRPDWATGGLAALQAQALDPFKTRIAICNCVYGAQAVYNQDLAAALCRAMNDWLAAEWLAKDDRLRASIVVPWQSPELAAEEIDRRAADRRFVQVLLLVMGEIPLGRRAMWPIYADAERHNLPVGIHAGSIYRSAPWTNGWPSYHVEDQASQSVGFQTQLLSLLSEGVFEKFPRLKVVLMESGVSWVPGFFWRIDKLWRGLRMEIPWISRPPSEILREHVRLTVQPFDAPDDAEIVQEIIGQIGSDDMLLFSTNYPNWHFDGVDALPKGFNPDLARRLMTENPLRTYQRLQES
ncbi:amidohydrolase family protein [Bradyrhizobium sp. 41S5]|uniref:amidohydrolase family protein n=1 Tax=Bradyrhizobium sp. 41S5 TaxID=1404443 RepID=UPI00156B1F71|nr:amidohydrolase family protein [Bradyrhizobium sp. 41S5]UFX44135.1 amidohydrolase family protein [Bradyrhizobium sp. 41S5]